MPDRGAGGALQQTIMQPELHREPGLAASDTRTEGNIAAMKAYFHVVGCVVAAESAPAAIDECVEWIRRQDSDILASNEREAIFVKFDAGDADLILQALRSAAFYRPPLLRFAFASGVKEAAGVRGKPRMGDRGIVQAFDLAGAARPGQVLVSSQLGSLMQVAQIPPADRLRPTRVKLLDGREASAYGIEPAPRARSADRST